MGEGDTFVNALIGAVVAIVTSFTGFGPLIGGGAAGFLNGRSGAKVGGLVGLFVAIPGALVVFLFSSALGFLPFMAGGEGGAILGGAGILIGVILFVGLLLYSAVLGIVGGILGVYIKRET